MQIAYGTLDEVNRYDAVRKRIVLPMVSALALLIAPGAQAQNTTENDIRRSVVKVLATQRWPHLLKPWSRRSPQPVLGSGAVIEGQRILTNAHLVMYSSPIYVQPYQSSDKLPAKVVALAPAIDLAVLRMEDEAFFKARPALKMSSELPKVNDAVGAYGYPIGGVGLSTTKGVISRIEFGPYNYSELGLRVEVSAPFNPGNSGGPAIVNGQMVGLVFGVSALGQNLGYLIPNEEIRASLRDIHGGNCPGKQQMWDDVQALENDALRAKLGLDQGTTGVLVRAPDCSEPAYPLKKGDVITRIGSYDIDNAGMVRVRENLRLLGLRL